MYINFRKMPVLLLTKTNIRVNRGPCTRTIYVSLPLKMERPKELGKSHSKNKPFHLIGWGRLVQVHQLGFLAEIHAYNANSVFSEQKKRTGFCSEILSVHWVCEWIPIIYVYPWTEVARCDVSGIIHKFVIKHRPQKIVVEYRYPFLNTKSTAKQQWPIILLKLNQV